MLSRSIPAVPGLWGFGSLIWAIFAILYGDEWGPHLVVAGWTITGVGMICLVLWEIHTRAQKMRQAVLDEQIAAKEAQEAAKEAQDRATATIIAATRANNSTAETRHRAVFARLDDLGREQEAARDRGVMYTAHLDRRLDALQANSDSHLDDTEERLLGALSDALGDAAATRDLRGKQVVSINGARAGRHH